MYGVQSVLDESLDLWPGVMDDHLRGARTTGCEALDGLAISEGMESLGRQSEGR